MFLCLSNGGSSFLWTPELKGVGKLCRVKTLALSSVEPVFFRPRFGNQNYGWSLKTHVAKKFIGKYVHRKSMLLDTVNMLDLNHLNEFLSFLNCQCIVKSKHNSSHKLKYFERYLGVESNL